MAQTLAWALTAKGDLGIAAARRIADDIDVGLQAGFKGHRIDRAPLGLVRDTRDLGDKSGALRRNALVQEARREQARPKARLAPPRGAPILPAPAVGAPPRIFRSRRVPEPRIAKSIHCFWLSVRSDLDFLYCS